MVKYLMAFIIAVPSLQFCSSQPELTNEEVIGVIQKFDHGWENKKMGEVDDALADGYKYFTQSGGIFSRDSVVATAGESDYHLNNMSRSDLDITIFGNTAVVSTRWRGKGTYRGKPFDEDQRCSIILVKKEGNLQIVSEHCTPIKLNRVFH